MASYYHYLGPCRSNIKIKKALEGSWSASATMTSDFTPKMNRLGVKRSRKVQGNFVRRRFSITSVFEMIKQLFWHHRVYLVKTHRKMYNLTLKGPMSCGDQSRSYCIWIDALMRETQWDHSRVSISSQSSEMSIKSAYGITKRNVFLDIYCSHGQVMVQMQHNCWLVPLQKPTYIRVDKHMSRLDGLANSWQFTNYPKKHWHRRQ